MNKDDLVNWISESGVNLSGVGVEILARHLHQKLRVQRALIYRDGYEQGKFDQQMLQFTGELLEEDLNSINANSLLLSKLKSTSILSVAQQLEHVLMNHLVHEEMNAYKFIEKYLNE